MRTILSCALYVGMAVAGSLDALGQTRVKVTQDNSIVLVENEYHLNAGGQTRIRIKGNQHLVALSFDTEPIKGRLIESAVLVCHKGDASIDELTVSTIQADWDEHKSNSETSGKQSQPGWGWPGAPFPSVTGGNSFSLFCRSPSEVRDGAYRWKIAPDLIHANAIGAAYGLTLHEVLADYSRNPTIWSRESAGKEPCLLVTFSDRRDAGPLPPRELRIIHEGGPDTLKLVLKAPASGFAYNVDVNGMSLPRWNIPFVRPDQTQTIPLRDLPLDKAERIEVSALTLNRQGERSAPAKISASVPVVSQIVFPDVPPTVSAPARADGIVVIPQEDKYDASGKAVGRLPENHASCNAVFDGRTVRLSAARGEVAGFQMLLKGTGPVTIDCRVPGIRSKMFRALYVDSPRGRVPDPLVDFDQLALTTNEAVPVFTDLFVPFAFPHGVVNGEITVSDGRKLPIELRVRKFAIPREASFLCEMNSYGLPDNARDFYSLQKTAYDHRVHCNILAYSHRTAAPGARKSNMDMLMESGRRMNEKKYNDIAPGAQSGWWDDFISVFGPYLSGKCFQNDHRGAVAAPGFYLTFHESWPLNARAFFNGNPDAYRAFAEHPEYEQTFVNILKDFASVALQQGWTNTGFQVYLNNKGKLRDAALNPWTLDEPTEFWDYRALRYYGELVKRARGPKYPVNIGYRIDISRPQFDRGQLYGVADMWVVSTDSFRQYKRLIADRMRETGERVWIYGAANGVEESNRATLEWVLEAYRHGATGVVPWQTINRDGKALTHADTLGLFILDESNGEKLWRHSMRLKAFRRAEQDIEYLELLRKKVFQYPDELRRFINHYAGDAVSGDWSHKLREAAAVLIEKSGRSE